MDAVDDQESLVQVLNMMQDGETEPLIGGGTCELVSVVTGFVEVLRAELPQNVFQDCWDFRRDC